MANVIRHAYQNKPGQPIEVEVEVDADPAHAVGDNLRIRIRDWGSGANPEAARTREYVPGELGGLGLVCLKQLMDRVEYAPQPGGGVLLTMVKKRA